MRRTPSRGSPSPLGTAGEEAAAAPRCPAHGHLSRTWSAEAKKLTLSHSSASLSSPSSSTSPSFSSSTSTTTTTNPNHHHHHHLLLPLHKPLHNPGGVGPAALPLTVSHLTRLPVVVGARDGAGPGGAPELAAWLLVEGGAWAARVAEEAAAEKKKKAGEAEGKKAEKVVGGGSVSFIDDAAD